MSTYIDTGVLVKLYCPELDSMKAINAVERCSPPIVLTAWQSLELNNAMRLKHFRKELSGEDVETILQRIDQDIDGGILMPLKLDHGLVLSAAEAISSVYTRRHGCRTLDIIHVAAAQVLQAKCFITFDQRQLQIAKSVGLHVIS